MRPHFRSGAIKRAADYRARLAYEMGVVERWVSLVLPHRLRDFIGYARDQRLCRRRPRAAGAPRARSHPRALRITEIDPLRYDLLFERFLNPERISMPRLIGIDFCRARRRGR